MRTTVIEGSSRHVQVAAAPRCHFMAKDSTVCCATPSRTLPPATYTRPPDTAARGTAHCAHLAPSADIHANEPDGEHTSTELRSFVPSKPPTTASSGAAWRGRWSLTPPSSIPWIMAQAGYTLFVCSWRILSARRARRMSSAWRVHCKASAHAPRPSTHAQTPCRRRTTRVRCVSTRVRCVNYSSTVCVDSTDPPPRVPRSERLPPPSGGKSML